MMGGIFGVIGKNIISDSTNIKLLSKNAEALERNFSAVVMVKQRRGYIYKSELPLSKLIENVPLAHADLLLGYVGDALVYRDDILMLHHGNAKIAKIFKDALAQETIATAGKIVLATAKSEVDAIFYLPIEGKMCLVSNSDSLYCAQKDEGFIFASSGIASDEVQNITGARVLDAPLCKKPFREENIVRRKCKVSLLQFFESVTRW